MRGNLGKYFYNYKPGFIYYLKQNIKIKREGRIYCTKQKNIEQSYRKMEN